jgi:hypothetical protein
MHMYMHLEEETNPFNQVKFVPLTHQEDWQAIVYRINLNNSADVWTECWQNLLLLGQNVLHHIIVGKFDTNQPSTTL